MNRPTDFDPTEDACRRLDADDALAGWRDRFLRPEVAYFCGHSLGLQPEGARRLLDDELDKWRHRGVDGHFEGRHPWFSFHEACRDPLARLVGAEPREVVAMNSLTVNLHLLMVSFYRPEGERRAIVIEEGAFPSDLYAVQSQIAFHGGDPERDLIVIAPREGRATVEEADVEARLAEEGERVALVLWPGVQYLTGQAFDLGRLARATHAAGALFGVDAAHAAGNLRLTLHEDDVDFAVWCSYKYLNSGPGATAGAFVHGRHVDRGLVRFAGWWGNDPDTRFQMDQERRFVPVASADGWQLSNPPVLATAPLVASLELFDGATIEALRAKSLALTGYLEGWLALVAEATGARLEVLTPAEPARRGAQLSVRVDGDAKALQRRLAERGVLVDVRPPDVLRIAPAPLYVNYADVRRCGETLGEVLA